MVHWVIPNRSFNMQVQASTLDDNKSLLSKALQAALKVGKHTPARALFREHTDRQLEATRKGGDNE